MGPTISVISTVALGCPDPEEEEDTSEVSLESKEIVQTTEPLQVSDLIQAKGLESISSSPEISVLTPPTSNSEIKPSPCDPVTSEVAHQETKSGDVTAVVCDNIEEQQELGETDLHKVSCLSSASNPVTTSQASPPPQDIVHARDLTIAECSSFTSVSPPPSQTCPASLPTQPTDCEASPLSVSEFSCSSPAACGRAVVESETSLSPSSSLDYNVVGQGVPEADMETVNVVADPLDNSPPEDENYRNPMEELDEIELPVAKPLIAPSNTPINGDSGQSSPVQEPAVVEAPVEEVEEPKEKKEENKPVEKSGGAKAEKAKSTPAPPAKAEPVRESPRNGTKESKKDRGSSKSKKKEDKGIEYILRALNSLQTPEEKLAALCKRYADMHEEHRVLQTSFKSQQRSLTVLMREKDQVQGEYNKAIITKSKLESLCRELQKQNKLIKDESIQRAKEDDEKRREISTKFQTTIGDIQTQMNNNNERNTKLQKENLELAGQLKHFVEQYENREQKMKQHRDLEQQVAEARLAQARALLKEEQEKNAKEKELLLMKAAESARKVNLLEAQVNMFKERYDEFENLHARSNETFQKYKTEMDKMTKRIKRLEKDGLAWKSKWEKTNKSLVEAIDGRSAAEKETTVYVQKTKKLESLCRALQAELHKDKTTPPAAAEKVSPPSTASASESSSAFPVDEAPPNSPENNQPEDPQTPENNQPEDPQTPDSTTATASTKGDNQEDSALAGGDAEAKTKTTENAQGEEDAKATAPQSVNPTEADSTTVSADACKEEKPEQAKAT